MSVDRDSCCFVLFDPSNAPARLLRRPRAHWIAADAAAAAATPRWIEGQLAARREIALFAGFGAADALAGLGVRQHAGSPRVEALAFDSVQLPGDDTAVDAWLLGRLAAAGLADAPAGLAGWRAGIRRHDYDAALQRILDDLAAGDAYQVNYTFALHARVFGHPLALYRALRRAQPTPFRVLARLRSRWVLSLSPECFFDLDGRGGVETRPMKGTWPRQPGARCDALAASRLRDDPKNRAENLMILDLLRNDLGRVARTGSVQVPRRFTVEAYPTLWQMSSTVRACLRDDTDWTGLWRALFPCGSVVGAPKRRAMQIIAELEATGRGLYTGAIGWLRAAPWAAGDTGPRAAQARFSVAIRTLEVGATPRRGTRAARLGIGGGVVADSSADGEWRECWLKARFARDLDPGFGLIESFAVHGRWPCADLDAHLRRLARSARHFGFAFERRALLQALQRACARPPDGAPRDRRVRVELRHDGSFDIRDQPLPRVGRRVDVLLAEQILEDAALDADDPLLRHKTTHRPRYERCRRACERAGVFDALFFNQRGELCEGARCNVFVRLRDGWWTPPLRCGLLPGVARAALLADPAWRIGQRVLRHADLRQAQALLLSNAVHGALPARLRPPPSARDASERLGEAP